MAEFVLKNNFFEFNSKIKQQVSGTAIHSHKKRKDSLEGSPDRILFAAELEFPKILVPSLPQNSSNVNVKCDGKLKQLYCLCVQASWSTDTYLFCYSDINLFLIDYA